MPGATGICDSLHITGWRTSETGGVLIRPRGSRVHKVAQAAKLNCESMYRIDKIPALQARLG